MAHTQTHPVLLSSQREAFNSSGGKKLGVRERRRRRRQRRKRQRRKRRRERRRRQRRKRTEKEGDIFC